LFRRGRAANESGSATVTWLPRSFSLAASAAPRQVRSRIAARDDDPFGCAASTQTLDLWGPNDGGTNADRTSAAEQFAAAHRIAEQQGSKSLILRCALPWGRPRREEGRVEQGRDIVAAALGAIDGGADSRDVAAAQNFLEDG
jgi:hypothetical protein